MSVFVFLHVFEYTPEEQGGAGGKNFAKVQVFGKQRRHLEVKVQIKSWTTNETIDAIKFLRVLCNIKDTWSRLAARLSGSARGTWHR